MNGASCIVHLLNTDENIQRASCRSHDKRRARPVDYGLFTMVSLGKKLVARLDSGGSLRMKGVVANNE